MKLLLPVVTVVLVIIAAFDVGLLVVTQPKQPPPQPVFKERWQGVPHVPKEPRIIRVIPVSDKIPDRLVPEPDSQPEKVSDRVEQTFATMLLQPAEPEHEHYYRHRRRHRDRRD